MTRIAAGAIGARIASRTSPKAYLRGLADRGYQSSPAGTPVNYFTPDLYLPGGTPSISILVVPVFWTTLQPAQTVTGATAGSTQIGLPAGTTKLLKAGDTIVLLNATVGNQMPAGERVIVASGYVSGALSVPLTSAIIGTSYTLAGFNSPVIASANANDPGSSVNGTATNPVDQALAKINGTQTSGGNSFNASAPSYANSRASGVNLKLRFYAASRGPLWTCYLEDSSVGVAAGAGLASGPWRYSDLSDAAATPLMNPRYWTQAYRTAWKNFITQMATLYDGNASINEVCVDRAQMTTYPETLLRDVNDNNNANVLGATTAINDTTINCTGVTAAILLRLLPGAPVYLSHGASPYTFDEVVYTKDDGTYVNGTGWPSAAAVPIKNKVLVGGSTVGSWGDPTAAIDAGFLAPDAAKKPDNVTYWTPGATKTSGSGLVPGACGAGSSQASIAVAALQQAISATTPNGQPTIVQVNYGASTVEYFAFDTTGSPSGAAVGATSIPLAGGQVCRFAHGANQPVVPITAGSDRNAHFEQIWDAASIWATTPLSMAFNPYQAMEVLNQSGSPAVAPVARTDEPFTEFMRLYMRSVLGARAMIKNFSIRNPNLTSTGYPQMYPALTSGGVPLAFQTATPQNINSGGAGLLGPTSNVPPSGTPTSAQSLHATLQWARDTARANYVELPANGTMFYYYTDTAGTNDFQVATKDPAARTTSADGNTHTSTSIDSATFALTDADIGRMVTGTDIPADTYITARTGTTVATLSKAATGTHASIAFTVVAGSFLTPADALTYDTGFRANPIGFPGRVAAGARATAGARIAS